MTKSFHHAFRFEYDGLMASLITPVLVDQATLIRRKEINPIQVNALWDTGATSSVIIPKLAEHLKLIPIEKTMTCGVNDSKEECNVYLIDLVLPNNVGFTNIKIIESNFVGADILIGMDIIQAGDFAISNGGGKTLFSYCIPSHQNKTCLFEKSEEINGRKQTNIPLKE